MKTTVYRVNTCEDLRRQRKELSGRSRSGAAAVLFVLVIAAVMTGSAVAKTFKVNSGFDVNDLDPGNGLCVAYLIISPPFVLPFCTLRAAIEESNGLVGDDVIELQPSMMSLTIEGANEDTAKSGDLDITETVTIAGRGADKTIIDARGIDRILDVIADNVTLVLKDMSLVNGDAPIASGGGGAIYNRGRLILDNVVMTGHSAAQSRGGIISNQGRCSIDKSLFEGGRAAEGGALYNGPGARMTLSSSTVSASYAVVGAGISNHSDMTVVNSTISGNGSDATRHGGGVENQGILQLTHTTVYGNAALSGGGISYLISNSNSVDLRNSVVAENVGGDCSPANGGSADRYVLDSDGSCTSGATGITAVDPGLKALKNNGGSTPTHSLLPSSPARDSGMLFGTPAVDQRGVSRPQGRGIDRGAVEAEVFTPLPMIYPLLQEPVGESAF